MLPISAPDTGSLPDLAGTPDVLDELFVKVFAEGEDGFEGVAPEDEAAFVALGGIV